MGHAWVIEDGNNHTVSEFKPYQNEVSLVNYENHLLSELYTGNKTACEIPRSRHRRGITSGNSREM